MSEKSSFTIGSIEWCDLTVEHAGQVSDFYTKVVGWDTSPASMGDYDDFNVNIADSAETIAGICHARGGNSNFPAQWLMYVRVESVTASVDMCLANGGKVLEGPRKMGSSDFCIIEDPAGAVIALVSG